MLSAGLRNDVLREFLDLGPDDTVIDLGCGSGRALLWNADLGGYGVGIDVSPYFAEQARDRVDLVLGDLRRLPFADGAFTKAYALDVLEHLSREALEPMLAEASRVLKPDGRLFVYSHVRKNASIAIGLRWINRAAAALDRAGLIDLRQERLRKSDHVNPLADVPDLSDTVGRAGFRIDRIRYYTPLVGGFVENILLRLAERAATLAVGSREQPEAAARQARAAGKRMVARQGFVYRALRAVTWLMKIDLWLFGSTRSGPFFALLVEGAARPPMRILYAAIDQTVPGPVGGAVHVEAVARGLASRGHEVHVLATPGEQGFPSNGAVWHEMHPPLARRQLRWMRSGDVLTLARRLAPDAIIERYYNFGGEGVRAAVETGALAVLEVNAPVIDYPGSPKHFVDRALLVEPMRRWRDWQCRAAGLIVTPSARIVPTWVPAERILRIEWGADTDRFRPDVVGAVPYAQAAGSHQWLFSPARSVAGMAR